MLDIEKTILLVRYVLESLDKLLDSVCPLKLLVVHTISLQLQLIMPQAHLLNKLPLLLIQGISLIIMICDLIHKDQI